MGPVGPRFMSKNKRVRVFYYPDRVEVHSPGLLLPGITVEQMERGEVQSKLRNSVLAGLLGNIPGYMEQIGSGVRFMLDETKRMDLPAPQFREMSEFIVTFQKAPALHAPEPRLQYKGGFPPPELVVEDRRAQQGVRRLSQMFTYV